MITDEEVIKIIELENGLGRRELHKKYPDISQGRFKRLITQKIKDDELKDLDFEEIAKMQKQKQKVLDQNLYLRRINRESNRQLEIIETLNEDFLNMFGPEHCVKEVRHEHIPFCAPELVVCLADLHGQVVIDESYNQYSFEILSKRLSKYADKITQHAQAVGAKKISIACLGDFINSARRVGEMLCNSTTTMNATIIVASLIQQFITDLYQKFPIKVYSVYGNESRIDKENDKALITNNFDFAIHNMIHQMFKSCDNVEVIFGNGCSQIIPVKGFNIAAVHGDESGFTQLPTRAVNLKKQQISKDEKLFIDYMIFGHLHSTLISGDGYSRCASMMGADPYSHDQLGYSGPAEQTILIVDDVITPIPINLQDVSNYNGYKVNY